MTVRITHTPGVGEHAVGAVVEMEDRRAANLVMKGYAVEVKAKPKKEKE